jgi:hypothetical protein
MLIKKYFSILFLVLSLTLYSQDPGHSLFVRIIDNGKFLRGNDLNKYKVVLLRQFMRFNGDRSLGYDNDSSAFFYFDWNSFGREIHEIIINHGKEVMTVRFKIEPDSIYKKGQYAYTEELYLDVPFMPGYYEVTNFKRGTKSGSSYEQGTKIFINEYHKWLTLAWNERKLKLDKK